MMYLEQKQNKAHTHTKKKEIKSCFSNISLHKKTLPLARGWTTTSPTKEFMKYAVKILQRVIKDSFVWLIC